MGLFAKAQKPTYHQHQFQTVESFRHDGIEIARRRPQRRQLPWREVSLFILAVLSFKVFLYFEMGGASYGAKVTDLLASDGLDRFAGLMMQLDPVTKFVIDLLRYGF